MNKINLEQVKSIINLEISTEEKILSQLLALYESQFVELCEKMTNLCANKKLSEMASIAHKLKSSAANLGFVEVEKRCLKIETEGKNLTDLNYPVIIQEIYNESLEALDQIKTYMTNNEAS